ncbi:MAG TPA: ATP-binding protein [Chthoniobacterales bacterium]|nr:ATP-binding protein [Chthoniobacterales bacterium]
MRRTDDSERAVLVLSPSGQDAQLAAGALEGAEIRACICNDLVDLTSRLTEQTNALLIAEEALVLDHLPVLLEQLGRQPPWSDVPVIILTAPGGGDRVSVQALKIFGPTANVSLLERPLRTVTLIAAVKVAVRARTRQLQVRDLIKERETILASISDAFSALDQNFRYVYVNDKVAELAGLPKEKMIGQVIWDIFPDAKQGEFYDRCIRAMETRQPDHFELFYKPWGRWLETRIYPASDGIVIFRADISERKAQEERILQNERKLKELEERVRLAVEAANVGTFDFYPPTGALAWSNRCNEIFGLPSNAKVDYATYINGIHPDDRHIIQETVESVLKPGSTTHYDIEYRVIGRDDRRERWVSEKGRAILDESGHAVRFIGTILDITASKNTAMALQSAKQQAEEANRAKDQFLAMLSHELRTPLTPVLMTISQLRRDPNLSDEVLRDLEMLHRNVELEALLIDDLLDLTRIAHGKLELHSDAVNVHTCIEHALSIAQTDLTNKKLQLSCRLEAAEHHCWADAARLQQVFWNLINNAVKFTPPEGRIEIRTQNDGAHHIVIEVEDTGVGIDPSVQPRIFNAFEQGGQSVTSKYGGLGLGLAVSKRIIDLHQGTISVRSPGANQGTTFTIELRAMETSLLDGPVYYVQDSPAKPARARILLVEDHNDTARVLLRLLERSGYDVGHADCLTAAKQLVAHRPFDLVISDLGLPDGSGLDLMRELRERHGLSGIALSGYGMDEDRAASKAAGFVEHFTKPIDPERLRSAVARLVSAKSV